MISNTTFKPIVNFKSAPVTSAKAQTTLQFLGNNKSSGDTVTFKSNSSKDKGTVNPDRVCNLAAHSILDSLRPDYKIDPNSENFRFHENFSEVAAYLVGFGKEMENMSKAGNALISFVNAVENNTLDLETANKRLTEILELKDSPKEFVAAVSNLEKD